MQDGGYFASASQFTNQLFRSCMGLEILAVQFYPTAPQKAQIESQHCKLWRVELVDTICYL